MKKEKKIFAKVKYTDDDDKEYEIELKSPQELERVLNSWADREGKLPKNIKVVPLPSFSLLIKNKTSIISSRLIHFLYP